MLSSLCGCRVIRSRGPRVLLRPRLLCSKVDDDRKKKDSKSSKGKKKPSYRSQKGFGITKRSENYSSWYSDVIHAADMIDQSPVRGCMIMKHWSLEIWDIIKAEMDRQIKRTGTKNSYFPLLVPLSYLSKEASHVEGFAKECAVVTHHRIRVDDNNSEGNAGLVTDETARLSDPLVIRPTSEATIWNAFSKWIKSYKDLPLKINQWANVMRWEMRPRPFLRNSEFLWQEGHTAHSTKQEAVAVTKQMLGIYKSFCEKCLAMPVVTGVKSDCERFAGAESTHTIEGLMQNGWALQCGTSHFLGTNFGNAFDVKFQCSDSSADLQPVWGTSWGVSTRLIGGLIMTHSDDLGLVLPPFVAPVQVVLIPLITSSTSPEQAAAIRAKVADLASQLAEGAVRCEVDDRDFNDVRPGAKYYEWERKGVPLRVVVGPKELAEGTVDMKRRVNLQNAESASVEGVVYENFAARVKSELDIIQAELLSQALSRLISKSHYVSSYNELQRIVEETEKIEGDGNEEYCSNQGFFLAPWAPCDDNESKVKDNLKLTIRCYPGAENFEDGAVWHRFKDKYEDIISGNAKCFFSGSVATEMAVFARNF